MQKVGCNLKVWPSFSTGRQHFTRSQKFTSLGSPTKNKDISVNAWYDNQWFLIVTHPINKVCVKYDPCVRFIMSTIQFVNLSLVHSTIFTCGLIAFLINGEVQLMPIKDSSIYFRGPFQAFLLQKCHQFPFTLWWVRFTVDINWSFLWWTCDSVCNFWLATQNMLIVFDLREITVVFLYPWGLQLSCRCRPWVCVIPAISMRYS